MNYPADNRGNNTHVKITFASKKLFDKHFNDINASGHTAPIIIAGEWTKVTGNTKYQSKCIINKDSQIYYLSDD